jgi:prepilin-type N-terminal cleavage/methylation domain-containing protein
MFKRFRGRMAGDAGFTLIELLVVVLIVGVLAAVGVPLYLGYVKEARLAEGKALLGSAITAAQACAQNDPATGCTLTQMRGKVGLDASNKTGDGKWAVSMSGGNLTLDTTANKFGPSGVAITVAGQVSPVDSIAVTGTTDANGAFSLRCNTTANTAATSSDPAC